MVLPRAIFEELDGSVYREFSESTSGMDLLELRLVLRELKDGKLSEVEKLYHHPGATEPNQGGTWVAWWPDPIQRARCSGARGGVGYRSVGVEVLEGAVHPEEVSAGACYALGAGVVYDDYLLDDV